MGSEMCIRDREITDNPKNKEVLKVIPKPTHMQRGLATILIEVPHKFTIDVMELIDIARKAVSAPTYELLKKEDEAKLIINALNKPRFTEDVVRHMARGVIEKFSKLPAETRIYLEYRSFESIHSHDLIAKLRTTLGALIEEIDN